MKLQGIFSSLKEFWRKLSKTVKRIILCVLAAVLILAVVLTVLLNQGQEYEVLFESVESSESAEILTALQDMGEEVRVDASGRILVPAERLYAVKMQLAILGFPKSTLSYDTFINNVSFMTTDFEKKQYLIFQLNDRLAATIQSLEGVKKAVVNISIPEQSDFGLSNQEDAPSASAAIEMKTGYELSPAQVKGIEHIISRAVPGLEVENVSITDSTGKLLKGSSADDSQSDFERLDFEAQFENRIAQKVHEHLAKVYGDDGVAVSVSAVLNYDKNLQESTDYTPSVNNDGMVQHQDTTTASGTTSSVGGVPGTDTNAEIPTYPQGTGGNDTYNQNTSSTDYLVNTLRQQIQREGYRIDRLTISTLVDDPALAPMEQAELVNIIAAASGALPEDITVVGMSFYTPPTEGQLPGEVTPGDEEAGSWWQTLLQPPYIFFLLGLLLLLILLFILWRVRKARKRRKLEEQRRLEEEEAAAAALLEQQRLEQEEAELAAISLQDAAENVSKESKMKEEIKNFAGNNPEIAAQLIKTWLRGGE